MENSEAGVRINAICPAFIDTELTRQSMDEEPIAQVEPMPALQHLGTCEEVANAVAWLFSDEPSFVTGEALDVDGGYLSQ